MQVFFTVDVNPGGFLYQAGQAYEMDAAMAARFIAQGVASLSPNADGASPASFLTAQAIGNLTRGKLRFSTDRPEASAALVGTVWQSSADTTDPEVECNGLSWVTRPVAATARASEEMSLERMLPLQALWVADDIAQADGSQVAGWVDRTVTQYTDAGYGRGATEAYNLTTDPLELSATTPSAADLAELQQLIALY